VALAIAGHGVARLGNGCALFVIIHEMIATERRAASLHPPAAVIWNVGFTILRLKLWIVMWVFLMVLGVWMVLRTPERSRQ
jgi:hypothetical protein